MAFQAAMQTMARLTASAEALAALGARLRADADGIALDPAIEQALDGVVDELGVELEALAPEERAAVALFARAFVRQAADLLEHPERQPGWVFEDPVILLSLGRGSATIAAAVGSVDVARGRAGHRWGGAARRGGRGRGAVGGLRRALAGPARRRARAVAVRARARRETIEGLEDRIELRDQRIEDLSDSEAYDVVWLPAPFLDPAIVPTALERTRQALKPGGYVIFGQYAAPPEPLAQRLVALRTIRSGGRVLSAGEATGCSARPDSTTSASSSAPGQRPCGWSSARAGRHPVGGGLLSRTSRAATPARSRPCWLRWCSRSRPTS